jgi:Ca2+-binding RTX toxin-like protein
MIRKLLITTTSLLALAPAAAHAGTASFDGGTLVYTPSSGGTLMSVSKLDDGRINLTTDIDDGFSDAPAGCEIDEHDPTEMACAAGGLRLEMGDGDDRLRVNGDLGIPVHMDGGSGDDTLSGSIEGTDETFLGGPGNDGASGYGGNDHLDGGPGDDGLTGGGGSDTVLGGEGTDKVSGEGNGKSVDADVVDGGPGYDTMESEWTTVGREGRGLVDVTLDGGAPDGYAGEGDDVRGIEKLSTHTPGSYAGTDGADELYVGGEQTKVEGRGGNDTIYTSYGKDAIDGGDGDDTIRGYDGDDVIVGGAGADTLIGDTLGQTCNVLTCSTYSGNDIIDARDGERDSLDCGLGADTAHVDVVDVHTNCEDVRVAADNGGDPSPEPGPGPGPGPNPPAGAKAAVTKKSLKAALRSGLAVRVTGAAGGRLALTARAKGVRVGGCVVTVGADGSGKCTLRFTAAGRRKLRRAKRATIRISGPGVATAVALKG